MGRKHMHGTKFTLGATHSINVGFEGILVTLKGRPGGTHLDPKIESLFSSVPDDKTGYMTISASN